MIPITAIWWPGTGWLATIASVAFIVAMLWSAHRHRRPAAPAKPEKPGPRSDAAAPPGAAEKPAEQDYIWR
jgi:hypothetical protein